MNLAGLTDDELRELKYEVEEEEHLRYQFIGPTLPRDYNLVPMSDMEKVLHELFKPSIVELMMRPSPFLGMVHEKP